MQSDYCSFQARQDVFWQKLAVNRTQKVCQIREVEWMQTGTKLVGKRYVTWRDSDVFSEIVLIEEKCQNDVMYVGHKDMLCRQLQLSCLSKLLLGHKIF